MGPPTMCHLWEIQTRTQNFPNRQWQGVQTTPNIGDSAPKYGSHQGEYIMQPIFSNPQTTLCTKIIPKTSKMPPKGYQNGGSQVGWLAWELSPTQPKSTQEIVKIYHKCIRNGRENLGFSQNGNGHRGRHHRWPRFMWIQYLLLLINIVMRKYTKIGTTSNR